MLMMVKRDETEVNVGLLIWAYVNCKIIIRRVEEKRQENPLKVGYLEGSLEEKGKRKRVFKGMGRRCVKMRYNSCSYMTYQLLGNLW